MSHWLNIEKDKFAVRYLLRPINTAVRRCGFRDTSCGRNCALRNVEQTLAVASQLLSALCMRYSCATPTLVVAGDAGDRITNYVVYVLQSSITLL